MTVLQLLFDTKGGYLRQTLAQALDLISADGHSAESYLVPRKFEPHVEFFVSTFKFPLLNDIEGEESYKATSELNFKSEVMQKLWHMQSIGLFLHQLHVAHVKSPGCEKAIAVRLEHRPLNPTYSHRFATRNLTV